MCSCVPEKDCIQNCSAQCLMHRPKKACEYHNIPHCIALARVQREECMVVSGMKASGNRPCSRHYIQPRNEKIRYEPITTLLLPLFVLLQVWSRSPISGIPHCFHFAHHYAGEMKALKAKADVFSFLIQHCIILLQNQTYLWPCKHYELPKIAAE